MSDDTDHDPMERDSDERGQGFTSSDLLAVLAVSSFLAAIGLTTFFLTTALAH
jgi:Tfp pilus assembly protein FimT